MCVICCSVSLHLLTHTVFTFTHSFNSSAGTFARRDQHGWYNWKWSQAEIKDNCFFQQSKQVQITWSKVKVYLSVFLTFVCSCLSCSHNCLQLLTSTAQIPHSDRVVFMTNLNTMSSKRRTKLNPKGLAWLRTFP